MIRDARPDDMPALLDMGAAFHAESAWASSLAPFDPRTFGATCETLAGGRGLLIAEEGGQPVGMIGGSVVPLYFNAAVPVAQEVFWYAAPQHRRGIGMALLDALGERVASAKARALIVAALESLRGEAVGALLGRKGFVPAERMYARILP